MKFYEFDEKQKKVDIFSERWYRHPETKKFYRNVTTILGIIDKGYNYEEWLKNVGHNAEIIVDKAGTFGTEFHALVQSFLLGNIVKYYDHQYLGEKTATALWERFNIWIAFWEELNKEHKVEYNPEGIEYIVYNDVLEYAGTIDLVCKIDGEPQIFDWKTGNIIGNKEELQLIAYCNPLKILKANIVHVPAIKPNKKGYRIKEIEYSDKMMNLFVVTKQVFDMENKDQPKFLTLPLEISKEDLITKEK